MHDTKGFIDRTAKAYLKLYKNASKADRLWVIRQHFEYINMVVEEQDRDWFFSQRGSYRSSLRWKIFIRFTNLV